jgi:hypothetical protein
VRQAAVVRGRVRQNGSGIDRRRRLVTAIPSVSGRTKRICLPVTIALGVTMLFQFLVSASCFCFPFFF